MQFIVPVFTIVLSLFAVTVSLYTFRSQKNDTSYGDVDKQYLNLLEIALTDPRLRSYDATSRFYKLPPDDAFLARYNIYAYMCWNLIETIYDRQRDHSSRQFQLSETWVPVIIEENRLHYTWFKHNLRLFKGDFQRFVTTDLNDIELAVGSVRELAQIYKRMEADFPPAERKERAHIELLMSKGRYRLLLAKHRVFNVVIGYAFVYEPESPKLLWLDYMAIDHKFQSAGYGTLLFNKIAQLRPGNHLGVMFEVEPATSPDARVLQDQQRRIAFYRRMGAKVIDVDYHLPTETGSQPMHLFFQPSPGVHLLPKDQIQQAIAAAVGYIHGDLAHGDAVMKDYLHAIYDHNA